jgi:DnaK suppressor protein
MVARETVLKEQLLAERERIAEELTGYRVEALPNPGYGNHMADDATAVFDQARSLALKHRLERSLEQIDAALKKFDRGTYGVCEACGERIDPARLEAKPYAELCLPCRQRAEQRRVV